MPTKAPDFDAIKPGQPVRVTITTEPRVEDDIQTVMRLMRNDPGIKRALKKGSNDRMKNLYVRMRGKRPWEVRRISAKIAKVNKGESWTMFWSPLMAADFRRIAKYVELKAS